MSNPLITILLPTYNGSRFITGSVESVLQQTFQDWELLVIDDGSIDDTREIVKEYERKDKRIRLIKNPVNLGIQKTLNKGLLEARGEYIARIDDDDRWVDKKKLEAQIMFFRNYPEYVLVGTGVIVIDEKGRELFRFLNPQTDKEIRNIILSKNCFTHSSVVFKKDIALEYGGYNESEDVRHAEDYDLWLAMGTKGEFYNIAEYSVVFTLRPGNISSQNKIVQFKNDIVIARKWRRHYPHYCKAVMRNYVRLFFYGFFRVIPLVGIKNRILRWYKNS